MADRELVVNRSGLTVAIDIGRDMSRAAFEAMVARGDLTPVKAEKTTPPPKPASPVSK